MNRFGAPWPQLIALEATMQSSEVTAARVMSPAFVTKSGVLHLLRSARVKNDGSPPR